MKTRREFIRNSGWVCAALASARTAHGQDAAKIDVVHGGSGTNLITVPPWVQLMSGGRLGVGWLTSRPADGLVEWRQEGEGDTGWREAWFVEDGLRQANGTSQRALIEGYDPSKPLSLRAVSRPIESFKPYKVTFGAAETSETLSLPPLVESGGAIAFAVFNDIHDRIANYPVLLEKAGEKIKFVVLNGDILQDPQSELQMAECLLKPMSGFAARGLPCYFGRGNHETRGAYARLMKQYLCLPENRYYGAMTLGATRLVFLDSGEDKPDSSSEYSGLVSFEAYIDSELRWLRQEIASDAFRAARWRIVVVHIPPDWQKNEAKLWHAERIMRDRFAPLFDEGGVTAVLSGHTHQMQLIPPCPERQRGFSWPVFIGGAPQLEKAAVIRVDAAEQCLRIRCIRSDGTVFAEKVWEHGV